MISRLWNEFFCVWLEKSEEENQKSQQHEEENDEIEKNGNPLFSYQLTGGKVRRRRRFFFQGYFTEWVRSIFLFLSLLFLEIVKLSENLICLKIFFKWGGKWGRENGKFWKCRICFRLKTFLVVCCFWCCFAMGKKFSAFYIQVVEQIWLPLSLSFSLFLPCVSMMYLKL